MHHMSKMPPKAKEQRPRKRQRSKEGNRERTLVTIQLQPESEASFSNNIAPQSKNTANETIGSKTESLKNNRKRKRKRKNTNEQSGPEPKSFSPWPNNSANETSGSKNEFVKKKRKPRWRKKKKTGQLVPEPKVSAPRLNNSDKETINVDTQLRETPLSRLKQPEVLMRYANLSSAFTLSSSPKFVKAAEIKKEKKDDSHGAENNPAQVKTESEVNRNDDCELTAIVKPVKKIKKEVIHNWDDDVVCIGRCIIEKEILEPVKSTFSTSYADDELMQCDTAPGSPENLSTSVSQSLIFTPEEMQFFSLQNQEPMNHSLESTVQPVSSLPTCVKDTVFCTGEGSGLEIPDADETDNMYDLENELQKFSDGNLSDGLLSLEELDICVKVLSSISNHASADFASKNALVKSFAASIQEIAPCSDESMDTSDNTYIPEKSNELKKNNHHLENRPREINKKSTCEIKKIDLSRLQNISKSADKKKDCDLPLLLTTSNSKKRTYSECLNYDSRSPSHTDPLDPAVIPNIDSASCSKPVSSTNLTSVRATKKFCPSPSHVSPADPRLIPTNNSASYYNSLSGTNLTSIPVIKEFCVSPSHTDLSDSPVIPKNNSASHLKSVSSANPTSISVTKKLCPSPSHSPVDPRLIPTNNSASYSNYFSSTSPVNSFASHPLPAEVQDVESFAYSSNHVSKNICQETNITNSIPAQLPTNNGSNFSIQSSALPKISKENRSFVNLVPNSLIQDIGVNFIHSSHFYLIIIMWRVEWFSEYENKSINNYAAPFPPILKNTSLSQVQSSYQSEMEYYNIYFKLLIVECWYKLYLSWRDTRQLNQEYYGKIRECETKNEFVKYVVEYFVPAAEKDSMPTESFIVQLKFTRLNNTIFHALGYVTNAVKRAFDSFHDHNNEAFKKLNVSGENILKFRIVIYTVYKCDDIDITRLLTHRKLMSVRHFLVQNDALNDLNESSLRKVILNPTTSPHKLSFSVPDENRSTSIPLNQICKHVLKPESLLVLVNSSLSLANKSAAIYYLVKEIQSKKPRSKVIICSKSENKLSVLCNDLQKHDGDVIFINDDPVPVLEKYSLKKLVERKIEGNPNLSRKLAHSKLLGKCSVISILLQGRYQFDTLKKLDIDYCILDDAHECTEPESVIPLTYGITKFILFGDKHASCDVTPITAKYGYNRSLFNRAI